MKRVFVKCARCRSTGRLCSCGYAPHSAWYPEHPPLDGQRLPCPDCYAARTRARLRNVVACGLAAVSPFADICWMVLAAALAVFLLLGETCQPHDAQ